MIVYELHGMPWLATINFVIEHTFEIISGLLVLHVQKLLS